MAVPSPLSVKLTPEGRVPDSDRAAVGAADGGHREEPALPAVKVVAAAEVMAGAAFTVRVKFWVAFGAHPVGRRDGEGRSPGAAPPGCPTGWRYRHRCR